MRSAEPADLQDSWIEGDETARWRTTSGHRGDASGSSLLEVDPGCRLPRHTDSAEETVVIVAGAAEVVVGDERAPVPAGGVALVPAGVPHEVRNAGEQVLRFAAVYAAADVVTTYEQPVQPAGERERDPLP